MPRFFILLLTLTAFTPAWADPLQDLDSLLSQGHAEGKSCKRFTKKWKSVVRGGLTRESPSHVDKKHALEVLSLLEKYPGKARSMAAAWEFFADHSAELRELADQASVMERFSRLEQQCELFSHYLHFTVLLKDVKAFAFTKKERAKVERLARKYLLEEASLAPFLGLGFKANLLDTYLDTIYEGDGQDILKARLKTFQESLEADRLQIQESQKTASAQSIAFHSAELAAWKKEKPVYQEIVREVFP